MSDTVLHPYNNWQCYQRMASKTLKLHNTGLHILSQHSLQAYPNLSI